MNESLFATTPAVTPRRRRVWHPFTQMREQESMPALVIASGQGGWLTDTEGRTYLDGNASVWTNVHGHNDPDLNAALRAQLERVAHSSLFGLTHEPGEQLAEKLVHLAPPGLEHVFYTDNGSGAVEVALKQSFQFWQLAGRPEKCGVVGMEGAYHGDTFGTMAVGDSGFFHDRFRPWCFGVHRFPAPAAHDAGASLDALEALLNKEGTRIACLILEPSVQGAAGMRLQPPGFVREVAALCRAHDVHLILDEVFVAFGRLGPMFVCADEGVTPDFLCLAKGLTGGYLPLAATLVGQRIHEAFLGTYESRRAFFHGHTFTGNPLAAAVALASVRKLEPLITSGVLAERARVFARLLNGTFAGHPHVRALRHRGFAAAVDLAPAAPGTRYPPGLRAALQVSFRAREHGLLIRPLGDSILLVPPLCLEAKDLARLVTRTRLAMDEVLPAMDPILS